MNLKLDVSAGVNWHLLMRAGDLTGLNSLLGMRKLFPWPHFQHFLPHFICRLKVLYFLLLTIIIRETGSYFLKVFHLFTKLNNVFYPWAIGNNPEFFSRSRQDLLMEVFWCLIFQTLNILKDLKPASARALPNKIIKNAILFK